MALELISTLTATGSSTTFTWTSLNTFGYKHLMLIGQGGFGAGAAVGIKVNNDSTTNAYRQIFFDGSVGQGTDSRGFYDTQFMLVGYKVGITGPTPFEAYFLEIDGSKHKNYHWNSGNPNGNVEIQYGGGVWANTAAINRIDVVSNVNWLSGSTVSLYGIK